MAAHHRTKRSPGTLESVLASLVLSTCCLINTAVAAPQTGWWWNPAESGRGFFIESQGGITYVAAYLYADDGRARWLVAGGSNADPYHYAGRLLEYGAGQTLFGAYVAPANPVDAGPVAVDFSDDTHGTITWTGGVVPIEREIFGSGPAAYVPESGWWWDAAESGSGYSIEVQGDNLFFVGFMYDAAGRPVWYYSAGPMDGVAAYGGPLLQFANGQTLDGTYHAPGTPATIGSLAIAFTAPDAATLTFTDAGAAGMDVPMKAGQSRSTAISREFRQVAHPFDFPTRYSGSFAQSLELDASQGPLTVKITSLAIGTGITWVMTNQHPQAPQGTQVTGQLTKYVPAPGGNVVVAVNYEADSPGASCSGSAARTFAFEDLQSALLISNLAEYVMQIGMSGDDLTFSVPVTCTIGTQTVQVSPYVAGDGVKLISPVLFAQDALLTGSIGPTQETPALKRTGSWQLIALPNGF
jgi:hypothetical protein